MEDLRAGAVRGCLNDDAVMVNSDKPGSGLADSETFVFQVHGCSKDLGFVAGGWVHHGLVRLDVDIFRVHSLLLGSLAHLIRIPIRSSNQCVCGSLREYSSRNRLCMGC